MIVAADQPRTLPPLPAPAWLTGPEWMAPPDGDRLFGIEAIARYLALPFLDVRTMIDMGRVSTERSGRAHTTTRSALVRHWLSIEARDVPTDRVGATPANIGGDDALGLLSGQEAMASYLGVTVGSIRHHRARNGLPTFWIGKTPFARRASLDRWRDCVAGETPKTRQLATIVSSRRSACEPGALIGGAEIATYLGWSRGEVFRAIYAGRLPAYRSKERGWAADPAALASFRREC